MTTTAAAFDVRDEFEIRENINEKYYTKREEEEEAKNTMKSNWNESQENHGRISIVKITFEIIIYLFIYSVSWVVIAVASI